MNEPTRSKPEVDSMASTRYQDYVIRDGKYIGRFEDMYRNAVEIPWHQDETVSAIFSDLTVAILKRRGIRSLLDVGCGVGYMAERLRKEIPELKRVVGLDISETAVARAAEMFPDIEFVSGTLENLRLEERFDAVVSKDVLWYVLDNLPDYLAGLARFSSRWVYLGQSFPYKRPFYGEEILPNAQVLLAYLAKQGHSVVYSVVERDAAYGGREYVHVLIEVSQ
ncbi:MAG: class I SAM-dependent methyltransferase [Sulfuritalea sp.]|nr:class I SAM-dependent methyltransferase [Sulfuritalea sp.]